MPCQLTWEHDDDGANPLGRAGKFTFEIDFDFEPGTDTPEFLVHSADDESPQVTFLDVFCNEVDFTDDDKGPRLPTFEEKSELERWFENQIRNSTDLRNNIREQCVDLVNFEADGDWDD
jgi:hypothetical protein